jgi:hypothetical protein
MARKKLTKKVLSDALRGWQEEIDRQKKTWRDVLFEKGTTPRDYEIYVENFTDFDTRLRLRALLSEYRAEVANYIDRMIADGRDYIDRKAQFEVYWNSPILPFGELTR